MKRLLLSILIICLLLSNLSAQQEPVIRNLNLYYKNKKALINYDLKDFKRSDKYHTIELLFVDRNFNVIVPEKITGDFGDTITAGKNKQIQWYIFDDDINISRQLKPIVLADGLRTGGSSNALWSVFVPGLGDYFVENPRNMVFKPYLKTILFFGSLSLAIIADQNRIPLTWKTWHRNILGDWSEFGYSHTYDYWLFKFDTETFLFTAASIWILDLIWVYAKGNQNERLKIFTKYKPAVTKNKDFTNVGLNINL